MFTQRKTIKGDLLDVTQQVTITSLTTLGLTIDECPGLKSIDLLKGIVTVFSTTGGKVIHLRLGKYLRRIGKDTLVIDKICRELKVMQLVYKLELKFTETSEQVIDVYRRGPKSCMRDCDAVEVYATNDVCVAYMEDDAGVVIARAVVCKNPDLGLHYDTVYGNKDAIIHKLQECGYTKGSLQGCRLLHKVNNDGVIVMPYVDHTYTVDLVDGYMVLTEYGEYGCQGTDGTVEQSICCNCGERGHSDDGCWSEYHDEHFCDTCFDDAHTLIDGNWYAHESTDVQLLEDGTYVLEHDACYVDCRDEYHHRDSCMYNSYTDEYYLREDFDLL